MTERPPAAAGAVPPGPPPLPFGPRQAEVSRQTAETTVRVRLNLDGGGTCDVATGVPFLDHMLTQVARHGGLDLQVSARGDVEVDDHHTVEDVGIVLGQALRQALGDGAGIRRYGHALLPMDEALALCALDISGRPYLALDAAFPRDKVGTFDTDLVAEFFRAVAGHGGLTLHLRLLAGTNAHHMIEALFKAFARALSAALERDARAGGVPSTKGSLL